MKTELVREALSDLSDSECLAIFQASRNLDSMAVGNLIVKQVGLYLADLPKDTTEDDAYDSSVWHDHYKSAQR